MILKLRGVTRPRDKLKPLYLHYHSVFGHQTWQVGDLSCGDSIMIFKSSHGLARSCDKLKTPLLSQYLWSPNLTTNMGTYNEEFPHIKLHDSSYLHFHKVHGHQICQDGDIRWGTLIQKFAWLLNPVVLRCHVTN